MQHWPLDAFKAAAEQLVRTCEWFPTPKHFEDLLRAGKPTAAEAWDRALEHARTSAYRRGELGDETIDLVVRCLGGYYAIAMCESENLHYLERRFTEHFESLSDRVEI